MKGGGRNDETPVLSPRKTQTRNKQEGTRISRMPQLEWGDKKRVIRFFGNCFVNTLMFLLERRVNN